ncbi:TlpA family protein disulfide reductase [Micromonospora cathayae]|uniref:Thioredoxin family protein n=1 Tax=Micromonospora cathayae TaxID=3028804 RepID=A0ABY7ZM27_9ACTN|nr:thioredoxin family protein [Micromonospora sp. HUAS 3]WDZ83337.1 thioredoxin family protein [Micromonospora sp. HUAS 3]
MRDSSLTGVMVVVGVLAAASAFGWWHRRRDGRLRAVGPPSGPAADPELPAALGIRPGVVTLVQFSSAFCAPCRAARRVLDAVRETLPGVHLVEVDVERHLDAVRELDVWRTPTVLVVDTAGRVVRRAAGVPDRQELIGVVTPLLTGADR